MAPEFVKEPHRKILEIIAVSGDQTPSAFRRAFQVLFIGKVAGVVIVGADGVDSLFSKDFRDDWT